MRRNSGRGLLYEVSKLSIIPEPNERATMSYADSLDQNIDFVIFKNESGRPEIGIRVTRDAKGFTNTPHKRLLSCFDSR